MSRADEIVDRGSDRLQDLAQKAARRGGAVARLAELLAEDAAFLRKLKPSLITARVRGERPSGDGRVRPLPAPERSAGTGVNPFVVLGVASIAGVLTAKLLDWRGHAHPRG